MNIKKGTTRLIFVYKNVVIKVPIIKLDDAIKLIFNYVRQPDIRKTIKRIFREKPFYEITSVVTVRGLVLNGIIANWNEFFFCIRHKYPVYVAPAYFSLFGLLNVQKYGKNIETDLWVFRRKIDEVTEGNSKKNIHVFYSPANFCKLDGHVVCIDYGDRSTREVLLSHGTRIFNEMNL